MNIAATAHPQKPVRVYRRLKEGDLVGAGFRIVTKRRRFWWDAYYTDYRPAFKNYIDATAYIEKHGREDREYVLVEFVAGDE